MSLLKRADTSVIDPDFFFADDIDPSLERLAKDAAAQFVQFARIRLIEQAGWFETVIPSWYPYTWPRDHFAERLLSDAKHHGAALERSLQRLEQHFEQTKRKTNLEIGGRLLFQQREALSNIKEYIEVLRMFPIPIDYTERKNRGRRPGTNYPGLYELVFCLEECALIADGRFAVHRKVGPKGSLIDALDWLRDRILTGEPKIKPLADFLPAPRRHPVALYERALKTARKEHPDWVRSRTIRKV